MCSSSSEWHRDAVTLLKLGGVVWGAYVIGGVAGRAAGSLGGGLSTDSTSGLVLASRAMTFVLLAAVVM